MELQDGPEGPEGPVLYISYCARHAKPQPYQSGAPTPRRTVQAAACGSVCRLPRRSRPCAGVRSLGWLATALPTPSASPHTAARAGCRLVSESEELGDLPEAPARSSLHNGQPYPLPAKVGGWRPAAAAQCAACVHACGVRADVRHG